MNGREKSHIEIIEEKIIQVKSDIQKHESGLAKSGEFITTLPYDLREGLLNSKKSELMDLENQLKLERQQSFEMEIKIIIDRLYHLKNNFDALFSPDKVQGIVPPYISQGILKHFIYKLEKALEFEDELLQIKELRKTVSGNNSELLVEVDKTMTELDEKIHREVLSYRKLVEDQSMSNKNGEEIRRTRNDPAKTNSSHKENSISQQGFFSAKKVALSVIGIASTATLAALVYHRMG